MHSSGFTHLAVKNSAIKLNKQHRKNHTNEDVLGSLHRATIRIDEYRAQKMNLNLRLGMPKTNGYANLFDGIARAVDDHPVAHIEGVFDKEEDDTYYTHSASVALDSEEQLLTRQDLG